MNSIMIEQNDTMETVRSMLEHVEADLAQRIEEREEKRTALKYATAYIQQLRRDRSALRRALGLPAREKKEAEDEV